MVWAIVMLAGGVLAGGYIYRVLAPALATFDLPVKNPPARGREIAALTLALFAILLGCAPAGFFSFLQIGRALMVTPQ